MRRRLLRIAADRLAPKDVEIGLLTVEQARQVAEQSEVGAQSALPGGVLLTVGYETLDFTALAAVAPHNAPQLPGAEPIPLPVPGRVALANGWEIVAEMAAPDDLDVIYDNPNWWQAYLDEAQVGELVARGRLPGERFAPLGMGGQTTSLKAFMINGKVPANQRADWPLIADQAGLVWFVGRRLAERAKVTAATRQAIRLICRRVG
jgi:tRNA(Ile)-lysidine synthase